MVCRWVTTYVCIANSQELPKNYVKMSVIIPSCVSVAMPTSSDDKSSGPDPGTFCIEWSDL